MFKGGEEIYIVIYTFHMAAFIFLSGYLAKFDKKKILKLAICYFVFQTIWEVTNSIKSGNFHIDYFRPTWIMWYLFALIIFYMLIPLFDVKERYKKFLILILLFSLSLIAGYSNWIGYNFSLSRIFTFMPIFFLGYYLKNSKVFNELILCENMKLKSIIALKIISFLIMPLLIYMIINFPFNKYMLYGSYSYASAHYNPAIKIFIYALSMIWILSLLMLLPKQKIPIVSHIGMNTLPIYILHGFILKSIGTLNYDFALNIIISLSASLIIILVFGNKYVSKIIDFVCCGEWIFYLTNKYKKLEDAN